MCVCVSLFVVIALCLMDCLILTTKVVKKKCSCKNLNGLILLVFIFLLVRRRIPSQQGEDLVVCTISHTA